MNRKLPPEAFTFYLALGDSRSYEAVASHFGVTRRAVTKRATAEDWKERAKEVESKARHAVTEKAAESLEEVFARQLRVYRAIGGKALEVLRSTPLRSPMDAVRALDLSLSKEREMLMGEQPEGAVKDELEEAEPPTDAHSRSMVCKFTWESPLWVANIMVFTGQLWSPKDPRSSPKTCELVTRICQWLEQVVNTQRLSRRDAFHVLVLQALGHEKDSARKTEIEELILEIERELEGYRVRQKIRDDNPNSWDTLGIRPPGTGVETATIGWNEAFGCTDFRDPVSFLSFRIRKARERAEARERSARAAKLHWEGRRDLKPE